jgi:hypothetical protein
MDAVTDTVTIIRTSILTTETDVSLVRGTFVASTETNSQVVTQTPVTTQTETQEIIATAIVPARGQATGSVDLSPSLSSYAS